MHGVACLHLPPPQGLQEALAKMGLHLHLLQQATIPCRLKLCCPLRRPRPEHHNMAELLACLTSQVPISRRLEMHGSAPGWVNHRSSVMLWVTSGEV